MSAKSSRRSRARRRSSESGYAYVMALFLMVVMIVGSQVALRNLVTSGRREREKEMIWRGNQYVRAIRLYYKKEGHYPRSVDDLQKGLPGLHFVRAAAYKDPMNRDDGSWRVVYVNAAGQLIGSVRYASLQQMALMDMNGGKIPAALQGGSAAGTASPDINNQEPGPQPGQTSTSSPSPGGTPNANPGSQAGAEFGGFGQVSNTFGQAQPTGPVDGPVLGAFVAGIAGGNKYDRPSVKVYKGGTTYQQWEFIWNPLEDQARAVQSGLAPQGQQPGQPGLPVANPNGGSTGPAGPPGPSGGAPQPPPDQPLQQ